MWEGRPEQGDHGQSPMDSALQARPGVWPMSWLPVHSSRHSLLTLSTAMAGRTVANPGRRILMSQFHLSNHQKKENHPSQGSEQEGQDGMVYTGLPYQEYPYPPLQPWRRTSREGITCQPTHPITYSPARLDWAAACYLWRQSSKWKVQSCQWKQLTIFNNTGKNCNHNSCDCYETLIRVQIDNIQ